MAKKRNSKSNEDKELIARMNFMYGDAWKKAPGIYANMTKREIKTHQCCECGKAITEDEYIEYGQCCESCHNYWLNH